MSATSSRVKALLERTHGFKPSDSAPLPPSPDPVPTPKTLPKVELPNFAGLLTTLKPLSPKEETAKHNRSASLSTPRGRRKAGGRLEGLVTEYQRSRQLADKHLLTLDSASSALFSFISKAVREQRGPATAIQKSKEVLSAVKTEAVAMDRKCENLKKENAVLRERLASYQALDCTGDVMAVVRVHAGRKLPPITAFPEVVRQLREIADSEELQEDAVDYRVRSVLDQGSDSDEFYQDLSVLLCKQILLERNLRIKPGDSSRTE